MSNIFKNTLKTFKSDITGEERDYMVNNAVWIHMENDFGMNQSAFDKELNEGSNAAMAKFTTAVMKANGLEVSYEEVMENTDPKTVIEFYNGFFDIAFRADIEAEKKAAQEARTKRKNQSM